ncbi:MULTISPECIES: DnaJ family domain-containing protein [Bacillus]|uniref:DnaJ family domain-containing protein n=1 Tax=Bacillus TaxID=1386 RepID=UPI000410C303|nr:MULTISPECIES: DnaJ family domain-containing protein [Bacillus]QHZ48112.1 DUF1992 domain-containing protein [Bacillus sp. NSP9.1]WFA04190.1 DUF1992 domain-containing protein [Bacillus sp. HSf4]
MSKENDKRYIHWIDQAVQDSLNQDGGVQSLPGFGKPLSKEALQGDALSSTLKNAKYLPEWLKLQKEIKQEIEKASKSNKREEEIEDINRKIKKYNLSCPSQFQKGLVTAQNLESQLKHWS